MIILKIIGIIIAVIAVLVLTVLMLNVKLMFSYTEKGEVRFLVKILFFTFGNKNNSKPKKDKKPSRFVEKLKKRFGLDFIGEDALKQDVDENGISDTVNKVVTVISLLAGQFKWLLGKMRLDRLRILAVCSGGDAADAAMDYGIVCAAVYPLAALLTGNIKTAKNADDIQIGCDFDGNKHFEFDLFVSIRVIYLVRAVLRNANDVAERGINQEATNEQ